MKRSAACFSSKTIFTALMATLLGVTLVQTSSASILVTDHFNYEDGDLLTVSNGLWTKVTGTTPLNVSGGKAVVTYAASDDDARAFQPVGSGVLYYGLTATVTVAPSASGSYFATLWDGELDAQTDYFGRLQVTQGSSASTVKFGILNDSGNAPVYFTDAEFDLNTTVQIVVKFDFNTMTSTLWINPTDESSPSVTDPVAAVFGGDASTLGGLVLRQASGVGTTEVDYITVATTFEEVLAVPEPGSVALIGLGLGILLSNRRTRRFLADYHA